MSQWKRTSVGVAVCLAATLLVTGFPPPAQAGLRFQNAAVGGISIDGQGVVAQPTVDARQRLRERMMSEVDGPDAELGNKTELRKISLRRLEAAIAGAMDNNLGVLPEEIKYLAGIQRIKYVFVYPELGDVVLAGPGEGWQVNEDGEVVGVTTGLPVIHIDDLLVALRSAMAARDTGITCSIDPTPEGLRALDQLLKRQRVFDPRILPRIEEVMGPQQVTITGVPSDSHFARVLVACDYRMKRIGMNLEPSPVPSLVGFLDLVKSSRRRPRTMTPRWWLATDYEPLARSDDGLAWELRGPGVKAMTQDDFVAATGVVRRPGKVDPLAQQWADLMTQNYEPLSKEIMVFGQLRNLMDLAVIAALIEQEQLLSVANCQLPVLMRPDSELMTDGWNPAKTVATQCSFIKKGSNYVITASGGVDINSWQVIQKTVKDARVAETRQQASPPATTKWRWD